MATNAVTDVNEQKSKEAVTVPAGEGWVDVNTSMPEERKRIEMFTEAGHVLDGFFGKKGGYSGALTFRRHLMDTVIDETVTHWRPAELKMTAAYVAKRESDALQEAFDVALRALIEAKEAAKSWKSVDEALPEVGVVQRLLTYREGDMSQFTVAYYVESGEPGEKPEFYDTCPNVIEVTHWRPIDNDIAEEISHNVRPVWI